MWSEHRCLVRRIRVEAVVATNLAGDGGAAAQEEDLTVINASKIITQHAVNDILYVC